MEPRDAYRKINLLPQKDDLLPQKNDRTQLYVWLGVREERKSCPSFYHPAACRAMYRNTQQVEYAQH